MANPVVLVSGATSGIGRATAQRLARTGWRVFGTSRDPAKAPHDDGVELLPLEVTSDASTAACVAALAERTGGQLDALVCNVGTGILGAVEETGIGQVERLFQVNVFGAVRLVQAALPLMRARRTGRVVVMSSAGGTAAIPFAAFYCATKFALEAFAESLRHELRPLGISVTVVAPGAVSTPAGDTAMHAERPMPDVYPESAAFAKAFVEGIRKGMPPERVAAAIEGVLRAKSPPPRVTVGPEARALEVLRSVLPRRAFEAGVRWALGKR